MNFYYNPLDIACKSVIGAVRKSQKLNISVKSSGEGECNLFIRLDGESKAVCYPMQKVSGGFFVCLNNLKVGLYWYNFQYNGEWYGRNAELLAEKNAYGCFQLCVYDNSYKTPDWIKGGVIYQIFPDRFNKAGDFSPGKGKVKNENWESDPIYRNSDGLVLNNEFFGGNFEGIRQKLGYLKSLGVNLVYLNPINKAFSSHRYDTGDYLETDEVLGSKQELKELIDDAEKLGIRFVFDGVYNHTGADSVYFNKYNNYNETGAYNSKDSKYFDWYDFYDFPDGYLSWWDFETLPSIKKNSIGFQEFICESVLKANMELGFYGVRLDVVDELSDKFVKAIRKSVKDSNSNALVIGEVWEDATNKIAYGRRCEYFLGKELDSVMNYPLKDAIINYLLSKDATYLKNTINDQINNYPKCALDTLMNVLSTHDTPRIITVLGRSRVETNKDLMKYERLTEAEYKKGKKLALMAYALVFTLYGVPSVYYGDEAGLTGNLDPYNRRTFPWGNEDKEITEFIKRLAKIRRSHNVFKQGDTRVIYNKDGVFAFERVDEFEQIVTAVSRSSQTKVLNFDCQMIDLITEKTLGSSIELKQNQVLILKRKQ